MISLKITFVIFVLISGVIFTPSYSFAQSNQDENPLSSLFEILRQIFSFEERQSDSVPEFSEATVIQTSSTSSTDENIIPTANAGPDQTVLEFTNVTLDGSSSTDVDGSIQSYLWTQVSDPPVKLSSTSISNPTFEAPGVDSDDIVLRLSLEVTDDFGDTSTDQVDITITNAHSSPTANAGPDQTVLEFTNVTLDGSSSTDTNGDVKLFEWSQTDGPHVTLSSSTNINPTFTAPETDSNFILIFNLKVTDNDGDMDDDNVNVTVKDNNDDNNNDDNNNDDNNNDDNNNDDNNNDDNNNDDNNNKDNDDDKNKVTICHRPPGNPNNSHTIRIGDSAANAHLKHGDTFGECNDSESNDDHNDDDHNDENKNGNSDVDNSKVNNSGKDKNDNDKDNPGKGNKDNPGKGNKDNPGKGNKDNPGKGNKDNPGKGNKDNPGKGNKDNDDDHNDENKNGNSDVDNSKVNNSGKDKNDNDKDNPGKGNKDNPGKGNKDNPGKGNKDNDDDHNDENKNGNSDVDNSKVNNSGKDKNDNDTDNPGKGNKNNDDENEDDD